MIKLFEYVERNYLQGKDQKADLKNNNLRSEGLVTYPSVSLSLLRLFVMSSFFDNEYLIFFKENLKSRSYV